TGSERLHIFTIEEIGINTDKATCLFTLGQRQEAIELLTTSVESRLANYENVETLHILRAYFYLAQFYLQEK
ncbi:XRE family transcriptional regulator, partial [Acinetobacter baumannii]